MSAATTRHEHREATGKAEKAEPGRGRSAAFPSQIPWTGWKDILLRTYREMDGDNVFIVAAGVSFYATASLFPAMIALISLYGVVADPSQVAQGLAKVQGVLPNDVYSILNKQMLDIAAQPSASLGLGIVASAVGTMWAASAGVNALIKALNIAYDEHEDRSFVKVRGLSLLLTLFGLAVGVLNVALLAGLPTWLSFMSMSGWWSALAWPVVFATTTLAISALYRFGPSRQNARFYWVSWGAVFATTLWGAASAVFGAYVARFGTYQETYGAIGGFIVLMLWLYLTALSILLGAELNSEIEAQTAIDSTTGPPKPMGERGARKADVLGETSAKLNSN